uniref:Uncharacterized protein n=1 Tax=Panagrolaimus sp. JU765 TaxID=591449 RepID=A0AC34R6D6_9BILA
EKTEDARFDILAERIFQLYWLKKLVKNEINYLNFKKNWEAPILSSEDNQKKKLKAYNQTVRKLWDQTISRCSEILKGSTKTESDLFAELSPHYLIVLKDEFMGGSAFQASYLNNNEQISKLKLLVDESDENQEMEIIDFQKETTAKSSEPATTFSSESGTSDHSVSILQKRKQDLSESTAITINNKDYRSLQSEMAQRLKMGIFLSNDALQPFVKTCDSSEFHKMMASEERSFYLTQDYKLGWNYTDYSDSDIPQLTDGTLITFKSFYCHLFKCKMENISECINNIFVPCSIIIFSDSGKMEIKSILMEQIHYYLYMRNKLDKCFRYHARIETKDDRFDILAEQIFHSYWLKKSVKNEINFLKFKKNWKLPILSSENIQKKRQTLKVYKEKISEIWDQAVSRCSEILKGSTKTESDLIAELSPHYLIALKDEFIAGSASHAYNQISRLNLLADESEGNEDVEDSEEETTLGSNEFQSTSPEAGTSDNSNSQKRNRDLLESTTITINNKDYRSLQSEMAQRLKMGIFLSNDASQPFVKTQDSNERILLGFGSHQNQFKPKTTEASEMFISPCPKECTIDDRQWICINCGEFFKIQAVNCDSGKLVFDGLGTKYDYRSKMIAAFEEKYANLFRKEDFLPYRGSHMDLNFDQGQVPCSMIFFSNSGKIEIKNILMKEINPYLQPGYRYDSCLRHYAAIATKDTRFDILAEQIFQLYWLKKSVKNEINSLNFKENSIFPTLLLKDIEKKSQKLKIYDQEIKKLWDQTISNCSEILKGSTKTESDLFAELSPHYLLALRNGLITGSAYNNERISKIKLLDDESDENNTMKDAGEETTAGSKQKQDLMESATITMNNKDYRSLQTEMAQRLKMGIFLSNDALQPFVRTQGSNERILLGFGSHQNQFKPKRTEAPEMFISPCPLECTIDDRQWICINCGEFFKTQGFQVVCSCGTTHVTNLKLECFDPKHPKDFFPCEKHDPTSASITTSRRSSFSVVEDAQ